MLGYVLANFFVYAGVNAFTPGPGNILALNTVTNYGWGKGKPLFFGIFAGYYAVQLICAVFVYGVGEFLSHALPGFFTPYSKVLWILIGVEFLIATIGTIATFTWIGGGLLIQEFYSRHYRIINIVLALTLLECIWSMLCT